MTAAVTICVLIAAAGVLCVVMYRTGNAVPTMILAVSSLVMGLSAFNAATRLDPGFEVALNVAGIVGVAVGAVGLAAGLLLAVAEHREKRTADALKAQKKHAPKRPAEDEDLAS